MIEVQNLTKSYGGVAAIQSLNFKVKKGEVVGFLGPNGAGKSTTMKIITGFMAPTSGAARVAGFDVFENPIEVKRRIGYLPETPPLYMDMYVRDYLTYVAELKGVERAKLKSYVDLALEKTFLTDVQSRMIQNLSKGYKQRVGIAQALVSQPDILILDEPTVGLDPKQVAEIRDLIKSLKGHHTIVLSTHILPEVQATCERIIIINKGKIVAEDTIEGLTKSQQTSVGGRKILLRIRSTEESVEAKLKSISGVRDLTIENGLVSIHTNDDEAMVEKIAQVVIASGFGLQEISSAKVDLEDVFIKLTYGSQTGAQT
jgi:ABC-2 type transport system ATP-binding protein